MPDREAILSAEQVAPWLKVGLTQALADSHEALRKRVAVLEAGLRRITEQYDAGYLDEPAIIAARALLGGEAPADADAIHRVLARHAPREVCDECSPDAQEALGGVPAAAPEPLNPITELLRGGQVVGLSPREMIEDAVDELLAACPTCGSTDRAVRLFVLMDADEAQHRGIVPVPGEVIEKVCGDAWHDGETP